MARHQYRYRQILILITILLCVSFLGTYAFWNSRTDEPRGQRILIYTRLLKWDFNRSENMYHLMVYQLFARNILHSRSDGQVYSGMAESWSLDQTSKRLTLNFPQTSSEENFKQLFEILSSFAAPENSSELATILREHGMSVSSTPDRREIILSFQILPPSLLNILTHTNLAVYPQSKLPDPTADTRFVLKSKIAISENCETIEIEQRNTSTRHHIDICQDHNYIKENLRSYDAAFNLPVVLIPEFNSLGFQRLEIPKSVFLNAAFDPRNKFFQDLNIRERVGCSLRKAFLQSGMGLKLHPHLVPTENNEYLSQTLWTCDRAEAAPWPADFQLRLPFSEQFFPEILKERILWNLGLSPDKVTFVGDSFKHENSVDVFIMDWISSFPEVEFDLLGLRKENTYWYPIDERPLRDCLRIRRHTDYSQEREREFALCLKKVESQRWIFPVFQEATYFYVKAVKDFPLNRFRVEHLLSDYLAQ